MNIKPAFGCSIPWTGFSNEPDGRSQPCCLYKGYILSESGESMHVQNYTVEEIFHSQFMKDLRNQFRNGEKPTACSTCWTDENNGYRSKRIIYNEDIKRPVKIDWYQEPDDVSEMQLIINNSCNLKCRSCTPSHSTQWQIEIKKLTGDTGYRMPFNQSGEELGKLWTSRHNWYKNLTRLEVVGGEPFYVKQWHQIFNELIDCGYSKNIDLTMTTNATLLYEDLIIQLSNNFKSVSIGLSIDGDGSTYDYLRHPAKWDNVYENMKKYHLLKSFQMIDIQINYTIGWLNAYETPNFYDLIFNEFPNFKIWNNIIHYPEHMTLWAAPRSLKDEILNKWKIYDWKNYSDTCNSILNYMESRDIDSKQLLLNLEIFKKHDKIRNENLTESLPFLKKHLNEYF
jgi:sulfatase maturation enzyme AslB (radical SAM superfamily)